MGQSKPKGRAPLKAHLSKIIETVTNNANKYPSTK